MGSSMNFQVLRPTEALIALKTMMRFFIGVRAYMHQHFVPRVEPTLPPGASLPSAEEEPSRSGVRVKTSNMRSQFVQLCERLAAVGPSASYAPGRHRTQTVIRSYVQARIAALAITLKKNLIIN